MRITDLYPLGVISPSLPDYRDRPFPVPPSLAAPGATRTFKFLRTKRQTFQGQQNSCLPHLATQMIEDDILMRTGIYTDLSIAFVYIEGRRLHGWHKQNVGMWFRDAISIARRLGIPPNISMPYDPNDWTTEPTDEAREIALRNRAAEFFATPTSQDIKNALDAEHPTGICEVVHENVDEFGYEGIWHAPEGKQLGAHALEIDGYDETGEFAPDDSEIWFLGKNWWQKNADGSLWGVDHPMHDADPWFADHRARFWIRGSVIDSAASFDKFSLLRFPIAQ